MSLITTLLLGSLLAGPGLQETLEFRPAPGTSLEKIWTTTHVLRATRMNRALGDQRHPYYMPSDGISSEEVLGAVDHYIEVEGGRPAKFQRLFHKGRRTSQLFKTAGGSVAEKIRQKTELRGNSVVFTWIEDEAEYGRYYDALELPEEYLPALRADLDLLFVLPATPVKVGDKWSIEPAALVDLFGRGGSIPYREVEGKDDFLLRALDSGVAGGLEQAFGERAAGSVEVELREVRESDGARVAVLALTCDVRYARDRTAFVQENTIRQERREGIEYLDAFLTLDIKGEAEILWDLGEGRPAGLSFEGGETVFVRITHRAPMDPEGVERSQDVTLEGVLRIDATYGLPE